MEILIKMTGVALLGGIAATLLRKSEPEMAFLSILTASVILSGLFVLLLSLLRKKVTVWSGSIGVSEEWLACMLKITGCSLVSGISSRLCLDAGLQTAAYLVECGGTAVGMILALPIYKQLLELVQGLVW